MTMHQLEFFQIPNPCIGICISGKRGFCKGCFRSREERQHWHLLPDNTKNTILKACARRRQRFIQAQNKSTAPHTEQQQSDLFE